MLIRVFIKPEGRQWVDIDLPSENPGMAGLANVLQNEGFIVAPHALIPKGSILFIASMTPVTVRPNITVFPGGNKDTS